VPNQITDISTGAEAYLIVGGAPVLNAGNTSLPVTNGTVEVLHEVTVAIITVIDTLTVSATLLDSSGAGIPRASRHCRAPGSRLQHRNRQLRRAGPRFVSK
jgi:hypothetical protein